MHTLFMKKNEQLLFELLKQLIYNEEGLTTNEMAQIMNLPLHTIYRYIKKLKDDLAIVFEGNATTLSKKESTYYITIPTSLNVSYVIDSMRLYYIKISQRFSVIAAVLYRYYSSVEELAQDLNLSLSHTYKSLHSLNKALEPFDVSITLTPKGTQTNLQGNEKNLRLVMLYSYWMVYKGIEWPFKRSPSYFQELPVPINTKQFTPSQQTRLSYHVTFTYWQILYRKKLISLSPFFLAYLEIFNNVSPICFPTTIKDALHKNNVTDTKIHEEEVYFGFLTRLFIANTDSENDKVQIVNKLLMSDLPLANLTTSFLQSFLQEYTVSLTEKNYIFVYHLVIINLLYAKFFGIDIPFLQTTEEPSLSDKSVDPFFDTCQLELTNFTTKNLRGELFPTLNESSTLTSSITKLLYLILKGSFNKKPLNVLVQYSKSMYGYKLIKHNLSMVFEDSKMTFTSSAAKADIIISDSFEHNNNQDAFFYFEYPDDPKTWQNLILFISQKIYTHFF